MNTQENFEAGEFTRADDWAIVFNFFEGLFNPDGTKQIDPATKKQTTAPMDNLVLRMSIKRKATDQVPVINYNKIIVNNAGNGKYIFTVSHTDTDIQAGTYFYDIEMENNGSFTTLLHGNMPILPHSTKAF